MFQINPAKTDREWVIWFKFRKLSNVHFAGSMSIVLKFNIQLKTNIQGQKYRNINKKYQTR